MCIPWRFNYDFGVKGFGFNGGLQLASYKSLHLELRCMWPECWPYTVKKTLEIGTLTSGYRKKKKWILYCLNRWFPVVFPEFPAKGDDRRTRRRGAVCCQDHSLHTGRSHGHLCRRGGSFDTFWSGGCAWEAGIVRRGPIFETPWTWTVSSDISVFISPLSSCALQTEVLPEEEDEPDPTEAPVERFLARELEETRNLRPGAAKSVSGIRSGSREKRQLQSTTTVSGWKSLQYDAVFGHLFTLAETFHEANKCTVDISVWLNSSTISDICRGFLLAVIWLEIVNYNFLRAMAKKKV